jgi:hypothetical protein
MEKEISLTEPTYPMDISERAKSNKKTKNTLTLPPIANTSTSIIKGNSYRNINFQKLKSPKKAVNKRKYQTPVSSNRKRFKINKDLDLVYKLNMDIDVAQIFEDDLKLKKEKEKIDNNPDIKAKRLNIYKNTEENKNGKKMEVDPKEKEKYIEKTFKDELEKLEKIKNECNSINDEINQIRETIDEYKLEINVYDNYGDQLDKQFLKELKEKEKEKKLDNLYNNEILEEVNENAENEENNNNANENEEDEPTKKAKKEKFEQLNSFIQMKKQREERLKYLKQSIVSKQEELKSLEEKQNNLIGQCKEKKNGIYKLRQQLLNIYHISLYEGLNFRTDGLCTLIRAIWNLGVNVDINYMPSYLDNNSIDYLFDRTKRLIDISKMRQVIEENQNEFDINLKQWKQFANINENSKDTDNKTDSNFFQTGVIEKFNYMDKYPKSKQFMEEYNKKFFPKHEQIQINLRKKNEFKSKNIPYAIIEKYNNIEKLKYLLKKLIEQNDNKEKQEFERISKEFLTNNYQEKYQVAIETIMGALCGEEKRNEGINFFSKFQREFKEGKKLIQFHKNIK